MAELGRFNRLPVVRRAKVGLFLDAGALGEVLLPRRYVDPAWQVGDSIEVFLYHDSEDRVVATTETPKVQVGECAYLKVVTTGPVGAFLDWGLPKDLLAPFGEQQQKMQKGYSYTVFLYVDADTQRIVASSKLERHLHKMAPRFRPRQPVDLLIHGKSDLGFKAVVDGTHLGQLFASETFRPLHYGERLQGYVRRVRADGKIDLALQLPAHLERDRLTAAIVEHLRQNQGVSTLTDRSPPDDIYRAFGVSKANYKKALGQLYRQRTIRIEDNRITLC
ncbi:MAG: S1-like domain-containing RNA-binding protein [Gammaproteobacteria bacterium]|nr:S1-like domain-containing RNA-binding protein [Gammaproteobacteria bacterium]